MNTYTKTFLALLTCLLFAGCSTPTGGGGGGGATAPPADDETNANAQREQPPDANANQGDEPADEDEEPAPFALTSTAFGDGEPIPERYSGDGEDLSPPLAVGGVPEGTVELAITVVDPDAPEGDFVHWLIYGLPADAVELPEGFPADEELNDPPGARQGLNGFVEIGYRGPLPPEGQTHDYVFTLYALDAALDLEPGADFDAFTNAIHGHVIDQTELIGTFTR